MITSRPIQHQRDLGQMCQLAMAQINRFPFALDAAYRLTNTPLTSTSRHRLWESSSGQLLAWANVNARLYIFDYVVSESEIGGPLEKDVLDWGSQQSNDIAAERKQSFMPDIIIFADQMDRVPILMEAGYHPAKWNAVRYWCDTSFSFSFAAAHGSPIVIRPCQTEADLSIAVDLQRAAFGSQTMTVAWRNRVAEAPSYQSTFDLLALTPEGRPAGFALGWFHTEQQLMRIEPMGVHPDFRRRGIGRALLAAMCQLARQHKVPQIDLITGKSNQAGRAFYEANGFRLGAPLQTWTQEFHSLPASA